MTYDLYDPTEIMVQQFLVNQLIHPIITDADVKMIATAMLLFIKIRPIEYYKHDTLDLLKEYVGTFDLESWRYLFNGGGAYYHDN